MKLNEILEKINYFIRSTPVDVEGLALALNLKVERHNLSDEICGMIKKADNNYVIVVNQHHIQTRQRLTIAHELGHYIYHKNKIGDGIVDNALYRQTTYSGITNNNINAKDEQQANNFAANLLMPSSSIEKIIKELGKIDANELAKRLNISVRAIEIRLNNLGICK